METLDKITLEQVSPKSLDITSAAQATKQIPDVAIVGNGNLWQVLCKASSQSQGWMKCTKAMQMPHGCLVQVTTQHHENVAEAITFVPGVQIIHDPQFPGGRKLVVF